MYSTRLPFSLQLASTYLLQRAKIEQYISRRAQRNIFIAAAAAADNPQGVNVSGITAVVFILCSNG